MSHAHDPGYRYCPRCAHPLSSRCVKAGEPDRLCCDGCEFVFYLDPKLAAGVIATLDDRVLLLRRSIEPAYGAWVFPEASSTAASIRSRPQCGKPEKKRA
jgi:hypothetical protein